MKNEIDDLENELNALESDEEDEDHSGPKHNVPQPTIKKNEPKQPVETNNPPKSINASISEK